METARFPQRAYVPARESPRLDSNTATGGPVHGATESTRTAFQNTRGGQPSGRTPAGACAGEWADVGIPRLRASRSALRPSDQSVNPNGRFGNLLENNS